MSQLISFFILACSIVFAITIHECAHAWTANKLGDPTAKHAGRITLDPRKHIDPIGMIMLFIARIGWGKPVPVNTYNLKHPRRDHAIIALAGPLSNFTAATILSIPLTYFPYIIPDITLLQFLDTAVYINLILMVFNLIPIPPLDGSNILFSILPPSCSGIENSLRKNGVFILIGVFVLDHLALKNFGISLIGTVVGGGVNALQILLRFNG